VNFRVFFQFDDSALRPVSNEKFSINGACGSTADQIMPRPETSVHTALSRGDHGVTGLAGQLAYITVRAAGHVSWSRTPVLNKAICLIIVCLCNDNKQTGQLMPKIVDHDERRERVVEIVADMLATVGAEKTTIREIARQSGYSRGFIEHYFNNKEELITKTVHWINERSLARADEALEGKTGLKALKIFSEVSLPMTAEVRNEWKIRMQFWGMAAVSEEHRREQSRRIHVSEKNILWDTWSRLRSLVSWKPVLNCCCWRRVFCIDSMVSAVMLFCALPILPVSVRCRRWTTSWLKS
jgi:AcrR family transcriptional regulator